MAKKLTQLTVLASGTTETEAERSALRTVIVELNKQLEKMPGITLRVRTWPDDVRPGVNTYAQAELNRQIGTDYDIYLGILGTRFGTPTHQAQSGTEEEFNIALDRFRQDTQAVRVMFYFKRANEDPYAIDIEQLQLVRKFRNELELLGVVYRDFRDTSEFVQQTKDHLYNLIIEEWDGGGWRSLDGLDTLHVPHVSQSGAPGSTPSASIRDAEPVVIDSASALEGTIESEFDDSTDTLESELGLLEYMEVFHQSAESLVDIFRIMTENTTQVNERIRTRTSESEGLLQEHERLKHVGGSRAQQQFISKAKAIVDNAADDLDNYRKSMAAVISDYRTHSRAVYGNFRAALETSGQLWGEETKEENRTALLQLIEATETGLHNISEFQMTIRRLPALTRRFKVARNRTAMILGELVAEMTFSVGEAKAIADLLAPSAAQQVLHPTAANLIDSNREERPNGYSPTELNPT